MLKNFGFVVKAVVWLVVGFLIYNTLVRIIRHFYKFPIPAFMLGFIDNPVRRYFQPPFETALRHGIKPGMTVLEVGPGTGTYTLAAARHLGPDGWLITIDIVPSVIEKMAQTLAAAGVTNGEARVADVHALPFEDDTFDVITMIAVIGEIPDAPHAMTEFWRVLKPGGTLAFSELLVDPDYTPYGTLARMTREAGFTGQRQVGNPLLYTLLAEKQAEKPVENREVHHV